MKEQYKSCRTSIYNINYHIVWCVKYRRKILDDSLSAELIESAMQVGEEKGFTVESCKVGENDHVHCFVSAPPKLSPTNIVKYLKGITGRKLLFNHPELREQLYRGQIWNDSYFIETVGSTSEENVKKYIERQKTCQM